MDYLIQRSTGMTVCWIRKCGCTMLKNVFHYLNTGVIYPDPLAIHSDGRARQASAYFPEKGDAIDVANRFVVLRHPKARVASFYWDKVYSQSPYASQSTRDKLAKTAQQQNPRFDKFDQDPELTLDGHTANVLAMLDGIEYIINNPLEYTADLHFAKQVFAIERSEAKDFTKLKLEDFRNNFPNSLREASPEFEHAISIIPTAHESKKTIENEALFAGEVARRVEEIYSDDFDLYRESI